MEKVGEDEEKIIEETNNSEKTRSDKEDGRSTISELVDPLETIDPSNSNMVTSKDHDFNESDMEEEEKVLEFFRRNTGLIHEVSERSNFLNLETEQRNDEEIKSSSVSSEDDEDSSSSDELDSSLFRYYFDGSLPVSAHVQETETHQDESSVHEDENKMPLLLPKRRVMQQTSWKNCCGLLELLWAADQ